MSTDLVIEMGLAWKRLPDGKLETATHGECAREIERLTIERNNFEGALQLCEEALHRASRDALRYEVVRTHAADVTPEEMDRGADVIIASRRNAI